MVSSDVAKRKHEDTTVPAIKGSFEDAVKALLGTPAPPKNLGRPPAKKKRYRTPDAESPEVTEEQMRHAVRGADQYPKAFAKKAAKKR